jgi:hypothetical protein
MGARSFMVAARIPMSRDSFDKWLITPLPGLSAIENPSAMYTGWAREGADPDWGLEHCHPEAATAIRAARDSTPLLLLSDRTTKGVTLARHHRDALEIYLYDYYEDVHSAQTELLMLAGAGRFARSGSETPVLYWGGEVYPGLPMGGDRPLAVMVVGDARARFVETCSLGTLIEDLRPVEADFLAWEDPDQGGENVWWESSELLDPAVRAQVPSTR